MFIKKMNKEKKKFIREKIIKKIMKQCPRKVRTWKKSSDKKKEVWKVPDDKKRRFKWFRKKNNREERKRSKNNEKKNKE